jgi:hypothetical protein
MVNGLLKGNKCTYRPMKALDTDGGTIRDTALETVGLALTDKNLTICPELMSP